MLTKCRVFSKLFAMLYHDAPEPVDREKLLLTVDSFRLFLFREYMLIVFGCYMESDECQKNVMLNAATYSLVETSPAKLYVMLQLPELVSDNSLIAHGNDFARPLYSD